MALEPAKQTLDSALQTFRDGMVTSGRNAWQNTASIIKKMEVDPETGDVLNNAHNEALLNQIGIGMSIAFNTDSYQQRVDKLARSTVPVWNQVQEHYENKYGAASTEANRKARSTVNTSAMDIQTRMSFNALTVGVTTPVMDKIQQLVIGTATAQTVLDQSRQLIVERLEHFTGPQAEQVMEEYFRAVNRVYADHFLLSVARYEGPTGPTEKTPDAPRDFCEARIGKTFTREQRERWVSLEWDGKHNNTTEKNIDILLGGYGCRHYLEYIRAEEADIFR